VIPGVVILFRWGLDYRKVAAQKPDGMGVFGGFVGLVEKSVLTVRGVLHICRFTDGVQPVLPAFWLFPEEPGLVAR